MTGFDEKRQSVTERMDALTNSEEKTVPIEQVRELMDAVKDIFEGNFQDKDVELYGELGELAHYINDAKKQLKDLNPSTVAEEGIPDASNQLDAIVAQTEEATGKIMDSCEQLEAVQRRVKDRLISHEPPLDEDVLAGVDDAIMEGQNHITTIFEACNFQDLTGQRIMKIVGLLQEIERQVLRMIVVFGLNNKSNEIDDATKKTLEEEAELLEGPQLPGNRLEQDDIDDILAKLL